MEYPVKGNIPREVQTNLTITIKHQNMRKVQKMIVFLAALFAIACGFSFLANDDRPFIQQDIEVLTGGEVGEYSCSVTSNCFSFGQQTGSVSCTGKNCKRGTGWVECDGHRTNC